MEIIIGAILSPINTLPLIIVRKLEYLVILMQTEDD